MMENCIFCRIVHGEISAKIVHETPDVLAFHDVRPLAPVHVLVVPKMHIASMNDMTDDHRGLIGEMFLVAQRVVSDMKIADSGYKLLIRTGIHGGQEVPHVHLHVIGGAPLTEDIHADTAYGDVE